MKILKDYFVDKLSPILTSPQFKNYDLVLVGGIVRDYLLSNKIGDDCDVELISLDPEINVSQATNNFWNTLNQLKINFEVLPYHITKFRLININVGVSIGRIENFFEGQNHHKNFEPQYLLNQKYHLKWKRRDLTINAMGIELSGLKSPAKEGLLIDPFYGSNDLKNKLLVPCGDDFYRDPVRLLRLIRFKFLFDFNYSEKIEFKKFNLQNVSLFYLLKEGEKIGLSHFIHELNRLIDEHKIESNDYIDHLRLKNSSEKFGTFNHLIYLAVKNSDKSFLNFIQNKGLFSRKNLKKLSLYFKAADLDEKKILLEDIKKIGSDFYSWASYDS